ncbi:MAG: FAD binding domain-containing protein, partial [Candidatus Aminicenantes bacterium]|nr:FAD binding domain-containing protein [Candidatus Aminicenantes bacterium]
LSDRDITMENILNSIDGNICRCTGYYSIKRAAEKILKIVGTGIDDKDRISSLAGLSAIPDYFTEIPERLKGLTDSPDRDSESKAKENTLYIGGGTDLLVSGSGKPKLYVRFISDIENISDIFEDNNFIHVGAGSTVEDIIDSEILNKHFPGISDFMYLISSQIIRNTATLGGNIVNASPIGDLSVLFLALDPVLDIKSGDGIREVLFKEFFKDYKVMDLEPGELILKMKIPVYPGKRFFNFEKVSRRKYLDIASCNSASCFYLEGDVIKKCDLSAGGVAPVPLYMKESSTWLTGKEVSKETMNKVIEVAMDEISPISDVRGSSDYKRELLRRLIKAHFVKLNGWQK